MRVKVWILAQDTQRGGTEASVFGSKDALEDVQRQIMEDNELFIDEEETELSKLLESATVADAWRYWEQAKDPQDTYYVGEAEVDVNAPIVQDLLAQLQEAERFMRGFEHDEGQIGIDGCLKAMRETIAQAKAAISGEVAGTAD